MKDSSQLVCEGCYTTRYTAETVKHQYTGVQWCADC